MKIEEKFIVDELTKLRDIADKLIATITCPYRDVRVPPIDLPPVDCASSRCRCNPENVQAGGTEVPRTRCPVCAGFKVKAVSSSNPGERWFRCSECKYVGGMPPYVEKGAIRRYATECPECHSCNVVKQVAATYYCVPCDKQFNY